MSLSEEQSNEDNYRRDSFENRVCDDLSEVLLKSLSLEDKYRFECVSKQFQRTALLLKYSEYLEIPQRGDHNIESCKQLFQKYPKLNRISIYSYEYKSDLFEAIIKYCHNLTHIHFKNSTPIETEVQRKFFDKFGHQLMCLSIAHTNIDYDLIKAPNIEELIIDLFDRKLSKMKFNRLKRFEIQWYYWYDFDFLVLFIENNGKTLKHLDIVSRYPINDKERTKRLLKTIKKSKDLIHLGIDIEFGINEESFTDYWKQIAINCKQIKSLKLRLKNTESLRINDSMLSILKQFKRLKRLYLKLHFEDEDESDIHFHPFQDLKGLQGLTHLTIRVMVYRNHPNGRSLSSRNQNFNEKILTDIDINLPKLQYLNIEFRFNANEWTAQVLSRLISLQTIYVYIRNVEIVPQIERQLFLNCKHFNRFRNFHSN